MLTAIAKDKSLEPQLEKAMLELKKEYEFKHITVEYQKQYDANTGGCQESRSWNGCLYKTRK